MWKRWQRLCRNPLRKQSIGISTNKKRKNLEKTAEAIVPHPFEDVDIFTRGSGYNDFFCFQMMGVLKLALEVEKNEEWFVYILWKIGNMRFCEKCRDLSC